MTVPRRIVLLCASGIVLVCCNSSPVAIVQCPNAADILDTLMDGSTPYYVAADGNIYKEAPGGCELYLRYFTPGFEQANYVHHGDSVYCVTPDGLFPARSVFTEPFERYGAFTDMFLRGIGDTDRNWNAITLQSPLAKTVSEYNALRKSIIEGGGTFRDNRMDLVDDPTGVPNRVLKFTAVAPSVDMVTSKASLQSTLAYFAEGDDLWYEARYYFTDALPYSIADFESEWFEQSPGPRIVLSGGALAIENKFGAKLEFRQATPIPVPKNQWVTIKVHFSFHHTTGLVELWQAGVKIIAANAPTLPLAMAIQTNIEVGISATDQASVLYVDDIRLARSAF